LDLCNGIVKELCILEDWKSSAELPIYKGKGNPVELGPHLASVLSIVYLMSGRIKWRIEA